MNRALGEHAENELHAPLNEMKHKYFPFDLKHFFTNLKKLHYMLKA